jgi:SAM-dependent methyltransferase
VAFDVAADSYTRFMGRYSEQLAVRFADRLGVVPPADILDVGCGPGALTAVLVERLGAVAVHAVEPSASFHAAAQQRLPHVAIRRASAEDLPYDDDRFDGALAQLVVHFMTDPVAGLREMARVTRPGGIVAVNVWDYAGGRSPLSTFWRAARELDAAAPTESHLAGAREGHLEELLTAAGLRSVRGGDLEVAVPHPGFDDWWAPYLLGVGPAGDHVQGLDEERRTELRERCRTLLPQGPFEVRAAAWCAVGVVP